MMDSKPLTSGLSVSPQLTVADLPAVRKQGFRSVICNRPDGEQADQPAFADIARAAKEAGLEAEYQPVVAGKISDDDAEAFGEALTRLPGPVLAYCRTGTRSATLWSLSQATRMPVADILAATKAAGYDMGGVVQRIIDARKAPTGH